MGPLVLVLPTEVVKRLARESYRCGNRVEEKDGSHPTKGVTLALTSVVREARKALWQP